MKKLDMDGMRKLDLREIQQVGNAILQFIKKICSDHSIQFFLAYGTVIGAVRHKGFIPWDDDIDIYMTRTEYEKFKSVMRHSDEANTRYKLLDVTTEKDYFMPLVKVVDTHTRMDWRIVKRQLPYGVWVDVYVLDNVPDSDTELHRFQKGLDFLQKCFQHALYKSDFDCLKHIISSIAFWGPNLLGPRFFALQMAKESIRYNNSETRRFAPSAFTASSRSEAVLDKDVIGRGIPVTFEGTEYLAPEKTDTYLRHFYGDYMKLPKKEMRIANHTADFYLIMNDENA